MKKTIFKQSQFYVSDDGFSDNLLKKLSQNTLICKQENCTEYDNERRKELRIRIELFRKKCKAQYIYSTITSTVASFILCFALYNSNLRSDFLYKSIDHLNTGVTSTFERVNTFYTDLFRNSVKNSHISFSMNTESSEKSKE